MPRREPGEPYARVDSDEASAMLAAAPSGMVVIDVRRDDEWVTGHVTGAIHINGGGINYGTPFGGYKQSGNGREGGLMGLEDYLETKTLHGIT